MTVRVLVVDDSAFFRQRISSVLSASKEIEVVGIAHNGVEAIDMNNSLQPDVITMDVEMPKLNGIDALKQIMRIRPTKILMVSSLTHEGAQVTLQAMEAGAVDYLTKDMRAWMDKSPSLSRELISKIVAIGKSKYLARSQFSSTAKPIGRTTHFSSHTPCSIREERAVTAANQRSFNVTSKPKVPFGCKIIVIGSSTGGPAALQEILTKLPANFPYPILLIQHMPNTFTSVFAQRLDQQCAIAVKHAQSGDRLKPGVALLAPGGMQMILDSHNTVQVLAGDKELTYKPSIDLTFASTAKNFGSKALAIILTGMGADGRDGAKLLKEAGSNVWAQSESSCTIYGMPQAAAKAGVVDHVIDLKDFAGCLNLINN
ncbi:chemotaxis response regulator protein-glutamate methylesterase [Gammaproteobacteria bacterium AS21]